MSPIARQSQPAKTKQDKQNLICGNQPVQGERNPRSSLTIGLLPELPSSCSDLPDWQ